MLFELKISTDNAAEFALFGPEFSKFLENWNKISNSSPSAQLPAAPPATIAPVVSRKAEPPSVEVADAGANHSPALIPANIPETADLPPLPAVSGTEEAKKRTRRTKAQIEADRAAEAAKAELPKTNGAGAAGVSTVPSNYTIDDVKAAYNSMCKALGPKSRGVSAQLLLDLGVSKFSELTADKFARAIGEMQRKASQPDETAKKIDDEIEF